MVAAGGGGGGTRSSHCMLKILWRMRVVVKVTLPVCTAALILIFLLVHSQNPGIGFPNPDVMMAEDQVEVVSKQERSLKSAAEPNVQKWRRQRILAVCEQNGVGQPTNKAHIIPDQFNHIYVNDQYQFLYCEIPKVACTNWKRTLLMLTGKFNGSDPMALQSSKVHGEYMHKYLRTLDSYSRKEIQHKLNNYYKFVFVREPLERILSAYRNKFTTRYNEYFHKRYGRQIVQKYRKKPTAEALKQGHDVKFYEFVRYLLDPSVLESKLLNPHWRQYYKLCHPCAVQYDFIGKYEHLTEDFQQVMHELGIDRVVNFPPQPEDAKKLSTSELFYKAYKNITSEDIHRLWELYSVDYAMFGYSYPDLIGRH